MARKSKEALIDEILRKQSTPTYRTYNGDRACGANNQGNGECDTNCNTLQYNWDNGDCCPSTCIDSEEFQCGECGWDCQDPIAVENQYWNQPPTGDVDLNGDTNVSDVVALVNVFMNPDVQLTDEQFIRGT